MHKTRTFLKVDILIIALIFKRFNADLWTWSINYKCIPMSQESVNSNIKINRHLILGKMGSGITGFCKVSSVKGLKNSLKHVASDRNTPKEFILALALMLHVIYMVTIVVMNK